MTELVRLLQAPIYYISSEAFSLETSLKPAIVFFAFPINLALLSFIEMAEGLSTKLIRTLSLPSEAKACLLKGLQPKFRTILYGHANVIEEALAIGLVQTTALANMLADERLKQACEGLGLASEELPVGGDIFAENMVINHFNPCNAAYEVITSPGSKPVETLLKEVAETYKLRIRRYSLLNRRQLDSDEFLSSSDRYLTLYLFVHDRQAAVLVPEKYLLGVQAPDQQLLKAVFVSERPVEPPKVDKSLYEELKVSTELLTLVQDFAKPLLRYTDKLFQKYHAEEGTLALAGGELATAKESMMRVIEDLEGADFGDGGEAPLRSLKKQLSRLEELKRCEKCNLAAADLTLDCGHCMCTGCLRGQLPQDWLNVLGELTVIIYCPLCPAPIPLKDIKRVLEDDYKAKLADMEERCKLRLCPDCKEIHTILAYQELKCHHLVCKFCIGTKYTIDYVCPVCKQGAYQQDLIPDTLKYQCNLCNEEFFYKHTCGYCCMQTYGQNFYTEHSELCNKCLYAVYREKKCYCHGAPLELSEENIATLGQKLVVITDCHGQYVPVKDLISQSSCPHAICKDCLEHKLTNLTCPIDNIPFDKDSCRSVKQCCNCQQPMSDIELTCGHYIHSACVPSLLQNSRQSNHAKCFSCNRYIPPSDILPKIANQKELFAAFNDAFGYSFDFKCAKPNGLTKHLPISDKKLFWSSCDCHKQSVCPYCQAPGKAAASEHACSYISLRENVDAMLAMGHEVMQCPFCQFPDKASEEEYHQCARCQSYFAPCCCQSYEVIHFHGASYHRPNCQGYNPDGPQPENGSCTACTRNKKLCQQPAALQRPRLIGPGEAIPSL